MKCGECANWDEQGGPGSDIGICRKYAPRPTTCFSENGKRPTVFWPATGRNDRCAEANPDVTLGEMPL